MQCFGADFLVTDAEKRDIYKYPYLNIILATFLQKGGKHFRYVNFFDEPGGGVA